MSENCYTQEWLESSASNLTVSSEQWSHDHDETEEGFAAQLYSLCQSVLGNLCQDPPSSRRLQSLHLREELAKLYLWGHSFGPGELDSALGYSDDARYRVLDALADVGRSLLHGKIFEIQQDKLSEVHLDSWHLCKGI